MTIEIGANLLSAIVAFSISFAVAISIWAMFRHLK